MCPRYVGPVKSSAARQSDRARDFARVIVTVFIALFVLRIITGWISDATGRNITFDDVSGIYVVGDVLFTVTIGAVAVWLIFAARSYVEKH